SQRRFAVFGDSVLVRRLSHPPTRFDTDWMDEKFRIAIQILHQNAGTHMSADQCAHASSPRVWSATASLPRLNRARCDPPGLTLPQDARDPAQVVQFCNPSSPRRANAKYSNNLY